MNASSSLTADSAPEPSQTPVQAARHLPVSTTTEELDAAVRPANGRGDGLLASRGQIASGGGVLETTSNVVFSAPLSGVSLSAGFQFYVPCRFDTDILPVTIQDYGIGGSNSIKLIEVRPSDF